MVSLIIRVQLEQHVSSFMLRRIFIFFRRLPNFTRRTVKMRTKRGTIVNFLSILDIVEDYSNSMKTPL